MTDEPTPPEGTAVFESTLVEAGPMPLAPIMLAFSLVQTIALIVIAVAVVVD